MQNLTRTRPDEVDCDNCGKTVLPQDYAFVEGWCVFCKRD